MEQRLKVVMFLIIIIFFLLTTIQLYKVKNIKQKKKIEYLKKSKKRQWILFYIVFFISCFILVLGRYRYPCDYFANSDYEILVLMRLVLSVLQILIPAMLISYFLIDKKEKEILGENKAKFSKFLIIAVITFFIIGFINALVGAYYLEQCDDYINSYEGCEYCKISK